MKKKSTIYLSVIIVTIFSSSLQTFAQGTTDSPSSMFGMGELVTNETGKFAGMGGAGIALRNDNFLNTNNPAALTAIDSCKFVWEMGFHGKYDQYFAGTKHSHAEEGNFSNISLGFSYRKFAFAVGVVPYSSMGYAITETNSVEGPSIQTVNTVFEGNGGISKIYFSTAYKLFKNLSLGVNLNYLLGHTVETETMDASTQQITSRKVAGFADFGLQYYRPITKKYALTVGLVYGYKQNIHEINKIAIADENGGTGISQGLHKKPQIVPQYFGGGIALSSDKWIFTGDYRLVQWSPMKVDVVSFVDQNIFNVGASYLVGNLYREPLRLMGGLGYENSYVEKNSINPKTYSVSAGIGIPVVGGNTLSLGLKYAIQSADYTKFQKTNSLSFFLNISFHERSMRYKIE